MKHSFTTLLLAAAALATGSAHAATVTVGDPATGGIGYAWQIALGANDSGGSSSHVGAWSWQDQSLFTPGVDDPVGWTHTSNWVALTIGANSFVNISITRDASVPFIGSGNVGGFAAVDNMFPSFTLWRNWDNDLAPQAAADKYNTGAPMDDYHTYINTGAVDWAEDLVYIGHRANSTDPSVTGNFSLPAGQYTLVIGSDAPSTSSPPRQGYSALISTIPVPEPASALVALVSAAGLFIRRRR